MPCGCAGPFLRPQARHLRVLHVRDDPGRGKGEAHAGAWVGTGHDAVEVESEVTGGVEVAAALEVAVAAGVEVVDDAEVPAALVAAVAVDVEGGEGRCKIVGGLFAAAASSGKGRSLWRRPGGRNSQLPLR